MATEPDLVLVLATINLVGLKAGDVALVDAADPYIAGLLAAAYLEPMWPDPDV